MKKLITLLGIIGFICSCSSLPSKLEFKASKVIERIGGKDETPQWATGEQALIQEGNQVFFINSTTMSGNARTESCLRAAEETGRAQMLRYIKDAMTASGQVNELSASNDPGVESLTAFLSQGKISGASIAARYWEKKEESDVSGERVLRLRCAAKVAISKAILEKQLRDAIGGGEGNKELREKLIGAQKQFIDGIAKEGVQPDRTTASEPEKNAK